MAADESVFGEENFTGWNLETIERITFTLNLHDCGELHQIPQDANVDLLGSVIGNHNIELPAQSF